MHRRTALSLIEILVVIGILALLIGLILPAIQKAREASLRTQSRNNLHQIMLGFHHYAAAHDNQMPGIKEWNRPIATADEDDALFKVIARYLDVNIDSVVNSPAYVSMFVDPADPSWRANPGSSKAYEGNCSYAFNTWAFGGATRRIPTAYPDGTTNTIAVAGHYMRCGQGDDHHQFDWIVCAGDKFTTKRRATFADPYYGDVVPRVSPGFATTPSRWVTFQVAPSVGECDARVPQAPYHAGLLIAMVDGSVKLVGPSVDPTVFWAAVTRDGNETQQLD